MTVTSPQPRQDRGLSAAAGASSAIRSMADRLVHRLGAEGAERACRDNQWNGVLDEIRSREHPAGGPH